MASQRWIVEIKEKGQWVPQGDGPLPKKTAERIAKEIEKDFRIATRVVSA